MFALLLQLLGVKTDQQLVEVTPVTHHKGDGYHEHDVVGESYRMDALRSLMTDAEASGDWLKRDVIAHLVPVSNNRHDANAVEVRIEGKHVGFLDRSSAKRYRKRNGIDAQSVDAKIVGRDGNFGVKLDIE